MYPKESIKLVLCGLASQVEQVQVEQVQVETTHRWRWLLVEDTKYPDGT